MSGFAVAMILVGMPAAAEGGGFNPFEFAFGATFWTWTIFLLSLWPMWKFVFGPITKALGDRDGEVIEAARSAEQAKREAEKAVAAAQKELEHARSEGKRMVQEATARAERQGQEERRKAKLEAEQYLLKAREEIEAEKRRALGEIRREVVDLAVASASRILRREVDTEQHRALVGDFLEGLDERSN
jgi:F-type H+-transporting ATPase subunit b